MLVAITVAVSKLLELENKGQNLQNNYAAGPFYGVFRE
jgi:hypothetical protein